MAKATAAAKPAAPTHSKEVDTAIENFMKGKVK